MGKYAASIWMYTSRGGGWGIDRWNFVCEKCMRLKFFSCLAQFHFKPHRESQKENHHPWTISKPIFAIQLESIIIEDTPQCVIISVLELCHHIELNRNRDRSSAIYNFHVNWYFSFRSKLVRLKSTQRPDLFNHKWKHYSLFSNSSYSHCFEYKHS